MEKCKNVHDNTSNFSPGSGLSSVWARNQVQNQDHCICRCQLTQQDKEMVLGEAPKFGEINIHHGLKPGMHHRREQT